MSQCHGTTLRGDRCQQHAQRHTSYCHQHYPYFQGPKKKVPRLIDAYVAGFLAGAETGYKETSGNLLERFGRWLAGYQKEER